MNWHQVTGINILVFRVKGTQQAKENKSIIPEREDSNHLAVGLFLWEKTESGEEFLSKENLKPPT